MFCVGISPAELIEADAPPASDKAPATPNAVTTLLRPFPFEVCFERDIVATSLWLISLWLISAEPQPKNGLALPCAPYKQYLCFSKSGSLAMLGDDVPSLVILFLTEYQQATDCFVGIIFCRALRDGPSPPLQRVPCCELRGP